MKFEKWPKLASLQKTKRNFKSKLDAKLPNTNWFSKGICLLLIDTICYDAIIQMALSAMEKGPINLDWQSSSEKDI